MVSKVLLEVLDRIFGKRFLNIENVHKMKKNIETQKRSKSVKMHETEGT